MMIEDYKEKMAKIKKVFDDLEEMHYLTKMDGSQFTCCQTCALNEVDFKLEEHKGYVFFTEQDTENFLEDGILRLCYGGITEDTEKVGKVVWNELQKNDIKADWDGNINSRIRVF